jgi:hypothetical protein
MALATHHISLIAGVYNTVWFFGAATAEICETLPSPGDPAAFNQANTPKNQLESRSHSCGVLSSVRRTIFTIRCEHPL